MTVARSAAEVLAGHVTLEVECIDRMYLNITDPTSPGPIRAAYQQLATTIDSHTNRSGLAA
jgi:hypothetical protein